MKKLWPLFALVVALAVPRLSAVTVTTLNDDGPGSLRAAIAAGGNIEFAVTGAITLTSGELAISSSLVISGPGASQLTVQRSAADGTRAFRVLHVQSGAVTISGLTIRNGFGTGSDRDGGGILNRGALTLNDCTVSGNRSDADGRGAGLHNAYGAALTVNRCVFAGNVTAAGEGGGIYVFGQATINDSTFRENSGAGPYNRGGGLHVDYFGTGHVARCTFSANSVAGVNAQGGGIYNYGTLEIVNSTLSGNSSGGTGGGLHVDALSRGTTIRNCTIAGNSAKEGAGLFNNGFLPYGAGRITIIDSIAAGNSSAPEDIDNSGIINSGGHNLFGVIAGNSIVAGAGDHFGLGADALKLGPLGNNGGPTQTRSLLAGSPAINAGNETLFPPTDQRGVLRPFGARADIGAFELDQLLPTNQPPTISIISPANGAAFSAPANIFLIASVHDPDGIAVVATVEFFAGTNKLGNGQPFDPGPPHDAAFLLYWTNVPPGEYDLTAKVTDDHRATTVSAPVHIRVNGADNLPVVRITATDANAAEPHEPGTFTVSRDGSTNNTLNVLYLIRGSASNGLDYVTLSNRVTLPAGVRTAQINVVPIDDALVELVETVELRLTLPDGLPTYAIGSPSNAVVSIYDNDFPPTNQPPTITVVSPTNGATFTAPATILLLASVHDPEGLAWAANVEFFAGTNKIGNGQLFDPGPPHDAAFHFVWTNVPPGEYTLTAKVTDDHGATGVSALVHIRVQGVGSLPVIRITATDANAAEPHELGTFTVSRDGPTNNTLSVLYLIRGSASNGLDYVTLSNRVTLPAGVRSAQINVVPIDDVLVEAVETVELRLTLPDGLLTYAIGSPSNAVVSIYDNDPAPTLPVIRITATDANAAEPHEPGTFTVSRDGSTNNSLSVLYLIRGSASNGLDYVTLSNRVTLPAGVRSAQINVVPIDDTLVEPVETVELRLTLPDGLPTYAIGSPSNAVVSIYDNDFPPTNQPPTITIVSPTNGATFTAPANILLLASVHDSDGIAWAATVEFFAGTNKIGNGQLHDPGPLHDAAFLFYWTNVPPGEYSLTAKVTDDHGATAVSALVHIRVQGEGSLPVIRITATDANAAEPHEPGTFTVSRDGSTNNTLNVLYLIRGSASNGLDYVTLSNRVTLPAGVRSAQINVVPIDDVLVEPIETVELRLTLPDGLPTYAIGSPSNAVVTILDNDTSTTNLPPQVRIVFPTNGATFSASANIQICALAYDSTGYVATVEFFAGDVSLGIRTNLCPRCVNVMAPMYCLIWSNVPPGLYTLTAKATDDHGAAATSSEVHIRVQEATTLPVIRITATDANAAEPHEPGTFTVSRDGSTNNSLSVLYLIRGSASNGLDYVTLSNRVTLPAGVRSAQINVVPIDDALVEQVETVELRLTLPDGLPNYAIGSPSNAVVTVLDNDPLTNVYQPIVTIEATDAHASEASVLTVVDPGVFTVYRAGNTSATLYVRYRIDGTASNGLDYLSISNIVVIPAGAMSARIVINPVYDNLPEGTETVVLHLEEPICIAIFPPPPDCYRVGTPGAATVYIADFAATNHPPTVHIFTPTNGSLFVAPANIFIAAQAQDADGYLTIQTVEFFAGAHSLGIRTNYPTLDPIGPFRLTWTNVPPGAYVLTAKATDSGGAFGISSPVEIRVVEANHPPTNVLPVVTITASDAIAAEGTNYWHWPGWSNSPTGNLTNTATFVVRRASEANTPLTVQYEIGGTASNGVDYATLPGSVIIPAGHRTAEIKIVPVDDALPERIETVVLAVVSRPGVSNTPPPYVVGQPRRAGAIIVDNDQPRPLTGLLPDRSFHLMRPGANGTWWRVECSTDLIHWSALCTNSVTDGALHFVDPDGDELPQRFYRAVPELNPPLTE